MSEVTEKIYEDFEAQNEMIRSALDLFLDTLPSIADATQKIASAVAGGASNTAGGAAETGGEKAAPSAANVDLSKLSESLAGISKGLLEFNTIAGGGTKFVKFVSGLTKALTMNGQLKDQTAVATLYTAFGNAIKAVGSSITSMSLGMVLFGAANTIGATKAFIKFMDDFFKPERIKTIGGQDAVTMGKNLVSVSTAMKTMAVTLALLTPAMLIAIPGLLLLMPAMMVINMATSMFGNPATKMSVKGFAKSMRFFGIGMALFVLTAIATRFVQAEDLAMVSVIVGAYALSAVLFTLIDTLTGGGKTFESAAKGIALMSLGLLAFEVAAIGTRILTLEDICKVIIMTGTLALAAFVMSKIEGNAESAAEAMILISASLIVAELALFLINALDIKPVTYLIAAGMIATLGAAAAFMGEVSDKAIKGALAMIIVGASIMVAAIGVKMFDDVQPDSIVKASAVIIGLAVAVSIVGSIGTAVLIGAAAMLVMGAAVVVIAAGIRMFEDMNGEKVSKNIKATIGTTVKEFAKVALLSPFALIGSAAGLACGAALLVIGKGLDNLMNIGINPDKLTGKDGYIAKMLSAVISPFELLGIKYSFGSLASFLGASNPVADGINMVKGVGDVLCDIAKGVKSFANLQFKNGKGELVTMADGDFDKVAENLKKVITCVGDAFIEVGKNNEYDLGGSGDASSGFASFVKTITGSNPLQNAIKNFSGVSEILNGIASGLKGFSELRFGNVTFTSDAFGPEGQIAKNIKSVVVCVAEAFTDAWSVMSPNGEGSGLAGAAENLSNGNFIGALKSLGDTPIEKAIAGLSGVTEIANTIVNVADKLGANAGSVDTELIKTNISNIISGMTGGLTGVNALTVKDINAKTQYVKKVSDAIVNIADNSSKLKESADAMERICKALDNSFQTISDLAEDKLNNVKEIFDALVQLEEKESDRISEKMDKFGNMVEKSGSGSSSSQSASELSQSSASSEESTGKDGEKSPSTAELAAQIAQITKMLEDISTKLSGTLNVNVDDNNMLISTYRR